MKRYALFFLPLLLLLLSLPAPSGGGGDVAASPLSTPTLLLPRYILAPDDEGILSLSIQDNPGGIQSIDITIRFNPNVVQLLSVDKSALTASWTMAYQEQPFGILRVALANAAPLSGDGDILTLRFRAIAPEGVSTALTLARGDLNEGQIASALQSGRIYISSTDAQIISLPTGWTLMSFNRLTASAAVTEVMASVQGGYDRILGEEGTYDVTIPPSFNTLKDMLPGQAYWVHTTEAVALAITGTVMAADTPIELHEGWNWVGYLPEASMPITQALASIDGLYTRVIGDDGTYDVTIPPSFNTLKEMRPGAGYLIYMTQAATLTYPTGAVALQAPPVQSPADVELCPELKRTPWFSEIYGQAGAAYAGQVLRAYDPRGQLVGCAQVRTDGSYGLMRLYGPEVGLLTGLRFELGGVALSSPASFRWSPEHEVMRLDIPLPGSGGHRVWLPMIGR